MMRHKPEDFARGKHIEIRPYAEFKQDKQIRLNQIRISEVSMAGRKIVEDYPDLVAWFCLHVHHNRESVVEKRLSDADVLALVLREPEETVVRRGRQWVMPGRVWLPGYVLVKCVPSQAAFRGLLGVKDVAGIVGGWEKAYRVPDEAINKFNAVMQESEEERERKRLEQEAKNATITEGDRVRITLGPFAGFQAKVSKVIKAREKRCKLLIKVYGNENEVNMRLANLEKL